MGLWYLKDTDMSLRASRSAQFLDHLEFGKCNMRLHINIKPKEAIFQVVLDALSLTPFYQAFLITEEVLAIYIEILQICPKFLGQEFEDLRLEHDILFFIRDLGHSEDISYITDINKDAKKTNKMSYPRFTKIIIDYFMSNDQSISRRNKMFWHTALDDTMFTSMRCISRHEKTQVYGAILLKKLINQAMLESKAYKTYYVFSSREKTLKPKYFRKKTDSDTSPKQKSIQATKATKRSKKDFHISHASGSSDGVDTQSKVPDEQQHKTSGTDERTVTILGVPDVPIYDSKMIIMMMIVMTKGQSDRDEIPDPNLTNVDQTEHEEEYVDERVHTPSHYELTDDENIHDRENTNEEKDGVTKELYDDVNSGFEQEEEDAHVILTPVLDKQKTKSKRQHVDFRPPQTWISQVARTEEPPTLFDELNDTSFDFYAFVMNRLKIPNLTQEILVGPTFNYKRKRLMRADELYTFSDCTLNDAQSALYDIAARIIIEYLPMRKWSNLENKRARVMVQDIEKAALLEELFEAIEKRFGRNATIKKTQRNLLKQQYENFTAPSSEMIDQTFDTLQKLMSQLELLDEKLLREDVNQKLLRSLSHKWNTHAVVWRNKADLDTMSMDDVYNNLKVYEPEFKRMSSSSSNTRNMDFVSSLDNNTSNTNEVVNTAQEVSTDST
uniref:Uncharacterized protein n=1 Tax=Tanacetum cinerariifolium TaxID=118510 RepID=A0A6L2KS26_TANCI|nr:hypothetical protein [Tanacetum cinerariifolium]